MRWGCYLHVFECRVVFTGLVNGGLGCIYIERFCGDASVVLTSRMNMLVCVGQGT